MASACSPPLLPCAARTVGEVLSKRLPRLLFAVWDHFPLASGLCADGDPARSFSCAGPAPPKLQRVVVLAVRSNSVAERLDEKVGWVLRELAQGIRRPLKQRDSQRLELEAVPDGQGGQVHVVVNWHDSHDFVRLVLKGAPACAEAFACEEHASIIYESEEWAALRAGVVAACGSVDHPLACKPYLKSCAGAAQSLLRKADRAGRRELETSSADTLQALCMRAESVVGGASKCSVSLEVWRQRIADLLHKASSAPNVAATFEPALEKWCEVVRASDYKAFTAELQQGNAEDDIPAPLQAWCSSLRAQGFPVAHADAQPLPVPASSQESMGLFEGLLPEGSRVVFLAQVGSFMYDLQIESSDCDYRILFLSEAHTLASLYPPRDEFSRHINRGFAADKSGDTEYSGQELGIFVGELAKGNPRNVELLFSEKPAISNWAWAELRVSRTCFLTLRCASQYLRFVSDRLQRVGAAIEDSDAFNEVRASEVSKLLYHAHHKMCGLRQVLRGEAPVVAPAGTEHDRLMKLRLWRPGSVAEARALLDQAESERRVLADALEESIREQRLPAEVDAEFLLSWLRSVRVRSILEPPSSECLGWTPPVPGFHRSRSSDAHEAIQGLIGKVQDLENIRIIIAGYAISSRTMGTEHSGSDYDVKCIFVHPRLHYFGLNPLNKAFKHTFPIGVGSATVEVSGWEARHASQMLVDHNPSVLGLLLSPVFFTGASWAVRLREAAESCFDRRKLMIHWYRHAQRNHSDYISTCELPFRKRYVHVLRPLLSLAWLRRQGPASQCWPPARFADLLAAASIAGAVSQNEEAVVHALLAAREDLPKPLARERSLDALLLRLFESEQPPLAKDWDPAAALADGRAVWHKLCTELIQTMAPSAE